MTVTTGENLASDEWYGADDPPEVPADQPEPAAGEAPFGWTRDRQTGDIRPKKAPGRPHKPPGPEEIAAREPVAQGTDKPPRKREGKPPASDADVPMPKAGIIATGVNRLYRRGGKFLRIIDDELGLAMIECTKPDPDDPDALTVGQAWEAVAKTNPRIRAWLVNLIKGGAWQDLAMAHAPIALALFTKDWVRRFVPLHRAAEVLLEEDEDTELTDLRPADAEEMQRTAEAQAQKIASRMGVRVPPGVAAEAMRQAEEMAARGDLPPGLRRQQPRKNTRAQRKARAS